MRTETRKEEKTCKHSMRMFLRSRRKNFKRCTMDINPSTIPPFLNFMNHGYPPDPDRCFLPCGQLWQTKILRTDNRLLTFKTFITNRKKENRTM